MQSGEVAFGAVATRKTVYCPVKIILFILRNLLMNMLVTRIIENSVFINSPSGFREIHYNAFIDMKNNSITINCILHRIGGYERLRSYILSTISYILVHVYVNLFYKSISYKL
jgi:hypothetical protein